jgi:hypothetical protein
MQAVMTRVLLRARWIDKVCQGRWRTIVIVELYDRPPEALMGHVGVLTTIGKFRSQTQRLQDEMAGDF